jgi:flagellar protein FliO/FliZ
VSHALIRHLKGWVSVSIAQLAAFAATAAEQGRPFAAPQVADAPSPTGVTGLGQVTLSLAIVLAAIFAVAWLARRMRVIGHRKGAIIDVIAEAQMGPKERVVLLQVGGKQILVGVTAASINTLHVLETPVQLPEPGTPSSSPDKPNFRDLLMRSLGK